VTEANTPGWFTRALAVPSEERSVEVEGATIRYLYWGNGKKPGLVLVHGGAAHAHWWSFLAPLFLNNYDVAALDLSGHGDSDHRLTYPRELWGREIVAVAEHAKFPGPPVIIGHSLGGLVTIVTASLYGDRLAGAILVDSPVHKPNPESQEGERGKSFKNPKTYPDYESARKRFRLVPDQPCANDFILDYIARWSLKKVDAGLTWKFDPRVFDKFSEDNMQDYLKSTRCRVALLRGEFSKVVPFETGEYMYEQLDRTAPVVEIADAYHHLTLDQPLAFVAATRALLADWEHSIPRKHL
jgi:pimeloyl-ACP methyl ester carboxylesterase